MTLPTKIANILVASIVLVIALLASVDIIAMEMDRTINPHLDKKQKNIIEKRLSFFRTEHETSCDPKKRLDYDPKYCPAAAKKISQLEAIYYDNQPYNDEEIADIVYGFSLD